MFPHSRTTLDFILTHTVSEAKPSLKGWHPAIKNCQVIEGSRLCYAPEYTEYVGISLQVYIGCIRPYLNGNKEESFCKNITVNFEQRYILLSF